MKDIELRVYKILGEQLGVPQEEIMPESLFREDLGADSLDLVEMIMSFEEEFNVEISDEYVPHIDTVGKAILYFYNNPNVGN